MSSPRLATSVATRTLDCCDLNLARDANRRFWDNREWSATLDMPSSVSMPETRAARSHVETKTMADRAFFVVVSSSSSESSPRRESFQPEESGRFPPLPSPRRPPLAITVRMAVRRYASRTFEGMKTYSCLSPAGIRGIEVSSSTAAELDDSPPPSSSSRSSPGDVEEEPSRPLSPSSASSLPLFLSFFAAPPPPVSSSRMTNFWRGSLPNPAPAISSRLARLLVSVAENMSV
mmetsp:Transcript_52101/g.156363  ORF Transcript_52101/g.156363 Transcript_52101/m.156363 type:complete len:233 (-) Transcript_52101:789-1487(-)